MRKYIFLIPSVALFLFSCSRPKSEFKTLNDDMLKDKIAGGWAGKIIGVTYGAPTEFHAQGKTYDDSIHWVPADVKNSIWQDDIYVQLTFMMTMDEYGIDAPAKLFQEKFAKAGYELWHANLQARKNYFDSIFPPASGSPEYNLHADDIDFQIEADYIGLMCPAMPQTAVKIADKIGHIMNYGDGVYGGMFVAALYTAAFFETDVNRVVEEALKAIPENSDYARIVRDVVLLHKHFPADWRTAWSELEKKWAREDICGAGAPFNIDAKLNGAYIVMGLLYGEGDPLKTMEISTRCGQDSDCNPSNALAVAGVMKGFKNLPSGWQNAILAMADSTFIYTDYSFNKAVDKTLEYAGRLITENGGIIKGNKIKIKVQKPVAPPLEVAFPSVVFSSKSSVFGSEGWKFNGAWKEYKEVPWGEKAAIKQAVFSGKKGNEAVFNFKGTGISIVGNWRRDGGKAEVWLDGKLHRFIDTYYRSKEGHSGVSLWHAMNLPDGDHQVRIVITGDKRPEAEGTNVYLTEAVVFITGKKNSESYAFPF